MMSPIALPAGAILGVIELGKLGLQAYFQAMRMAGKSDEEINRLYQEEKAYFDAHPPDTLPDVPPDTEPDTPE